MEWTTASSNTVPEGGAGGKHVVSRNAMRWGNPTVALEIKLSACKSEREKEPLFLYNTVCTRLTKKQQLFCSFLFQLVPTEKHTDDVGEETTIRRVEMESLHRRRKRTADAMCVLSGLLLVCG